MMMHSANRARGSRKPMAAAFLFLTAVLAAAIACATPAPAQAAPLPGGWGSSTYTLTVKCVIDNASEFPAETNNKTFYYGYASFTSMSQSSRDWIYAPSVGTTQSLSFKNGDTKTVTARTSSAPTFIFMATTGTSARLAFTGIDYGTGTTTYVYDNNGRAQVPCEAFNWVKMTKTTGTVTLHFSYTGDLPEVHHQFTAELSGTKSIDYLGDGASNPDTARDGKNDYRLYLTADVGAVSDDNYHSKDVVFVLDVSGSMGESMGGQTRLARLKTQTTSMINELQEDGANTFSVISFATEANVLVNKGSASQALRAVNNLRADGGTSYYDALKSAYSVLSEVADNESVVIFVSDGEPTGAGQDVIGGGSGYTSDAPVGLIYAALAAKSITVDSIYSIYIGTSDAAASVLQTVTQFVTVTRERGSVKTGDEIELKKVMDALTVRLKRPATDVTITDQLSAYAAFRAGSAKVVRQVEGGTTRDLVQGTDYSLSYESATRTVKAVIHDTATPHTHYILSFDVSASVRAVQEWIATDGDYPNIGEDGTDYAGTGNTTSAGQAGYFSNDFAKVALDWDGGHEDVTLPKPVIQVSFEPESEADISIHVTLYNMELSRNMFLYELLDSNGENVSMAGNTMDGTVNFPKINYKTEGTWRYTIRPIVPVKGDPGWIEHMTYDDTQIPVTVKARVGSDRDGAASGIKLTVTYGVEPHLYCEYALRTTYQ